MKKKFIIECGSGNTCKNQIGIVEKMIDEVVKRDHGVYQIIFKWQLFKQAFPNVPLEHEVFSTAYWYAKLKGYQTTASVFDAESLDWLLMFDDLQYVKIACRPDLYWLMGEIPRKIKILASRTVTRPMPEPIAKYTDYRTVWMWCSPKYPAKVDEYELLKSIKFQGISDHTPGWELMHKYPWQYFEKHYVLERDESNPDAGEFAFTPEDLEGII